MGGAPTLTLFLGRALALVRTRRAALSSGFVLCKATYQLTMPDEHLTSPLTLADSFAEAEAAPFVLRDRTCGA